MLKLMILITGLVFSCESLAANDEGRTDRTARSGEQLSGIWHVLPTAVATAAEPGAIPKAFVLLLENGRLQGRYRWAGIESALSKLELSNGVLTFEVATFYGLQQRSASLSKDGEQLELWSSPRPAGKPEWIAQRVTLRELRAIERAAPKLTKIQRLPLPPPREVPSNGLARRPPMGWSSWNHFGEEIDDKTIREIADVLVESGLRDAGYVYVNIDDGWAGARDADGTLRPNSKFPNMKALGGYLHSKGLKFGIYSSPGPLTCAEYLGSHGYEEQDAHTFAQWGVDYLKYDWCSAEALYTRQGEMQAAYQKMGEALQASGRPIVYSLCQYGLLDVGKWGRKAGGNLWRTTGDIADTWESMSDNGFGQNGKEVDAGAGGWNDPDMLEIGNGGMTLEEYRTHMTLWSMLSAPLLLGNDVRQLSQETKGLLTNKEVIAVDQDALGEQGHRVLMAGTREVWTKRLSDGSTAVALFNRGSEPTQLDIPWHLLGLFNVMAVRDLWRHADASLQGASYHASLPPHGAALLRVVPDRRGPIT